LVEDPPAAAIDAYHEIRQPGFFDISALWRQFYDYATSQDYLHWHSVLVYVIGCGVLYALAVRNSCRKQYHAHPPWRSPNTRVTAEEKGASD
jgi:hypothetical protein